MQTEDVLRIEKFKLNQFLRLGLSMTQALEAVEIYQVDWHDLEEFMARQPNCSPTWAYKIVR